MFAANLIRGLALGVLVAIPAQASPLLVTVDTSALAGISAYVAFDLIGGPTPGNTVTLSSFATDGTVGSSSTTGTVSGAFPGTVTLDDTTTFFNEYSQAETLGMTFSFVFDTTANAPVDPTFPDSLSLFLLDPATGLPLVTTTDPTTSNALFLFNIGLSTLPDIYISDSVSLTAQPVSNGAPEPGSLPLLAAGIGALLGWRRLAR
jgi:hypothetical protein